MNQYDVAGILKTYLEKCSKCSDTKRLKKLVKELKSELDLRKVRVDEKNSM